MPGSDGLEFLGILKKSNELRFEPRRVLLGLVGAPRVVWSDGTVSIVVFLSPCVENLKVKKVIKVSYLNQESRQCYESFEIPIHLNVFTYSYISNIRIMAILQNDSTIIFVLTNIPGSLGFFHPRWFSILLSLVG